MDWYLKKFEDLSLDELYGLLKLRSEIFIVEQNCPYQDLDDKDQCSYHLFLKDDGQIIAYLRIIPENVAFEDMAIGRLIVSKDYRRQGISTQMMLKAIDVILSDFGKNRIRLSGQAYLTDFYTSLGFKRVSDEYLEDGIRHYEFLYTKI